MFERFKKNDANGDGYDDRGTVATSDRPVTTRDRDTDEGRFVRDREATVTGRETVRARQREEFGGTNWGAAFFGFLVAVGIAAILLGLLGAAGAVFQLNEVSDAQANRNADTIGLVGGILLVAVVTLAYWFGGYTSGRMSRFDGGRQGLGTWVIGLIVTIALAVAGWVIDPDWNVFNALGLPNVQIDQGTLTTGGAITLVAALVLSLLAAMGGGKAGERYHRKIDRFGFRD
jgi:hypothetical protein